jgi:hypothetical protein
MSADPSNEVASNNYHHLKNNFNKKITGMNNTNSFEENYEKLRFPKQTGYPGLTK